MLLVLTAIAVGAGAAVGTVMQGDLEANIPITVNQALIAEKPQPGPNFPTNRKFFASTSDDQTKFSLALEMFRGESVTVLVPIVNRSAGDGVAKFEVTLPDIPSLMVGVPGLVLEATGSGVIDDAVKVSPDTWTFTADASSNGLSSTPEDGILVTFKVSSTAMAGFFEITGRVRSTEF